MEPNAPIAPHLPDTVPPGWKPLARYAAGVVAGLLVIFAAWCGLFFLSFGFFDGFGDRNIFAWYQIKREAASALENRPKIVLAGGSNVLYGLRAADIENAFHVPCLNYGTHAALPLEYLIYRWKKALDPGDLLVLSPEWRLLERRREDINPVFVGYMLGGEPNFFFELNLRTQAEILFSTPISRLRLRFELSQKENQAIQNVYLEWMRAYYVNKSGDYFRNEPSRRDEANLQYLLKSPPADILASSFLKHAIEETPYWKTLRDFVAWAKKRNVLVVFAAPSVLAHADFSKRKYRKYFEAGEAHYRAIGIPVITEQSENFYPADLMLDSVYHLNATGTTQRTKQLIKALAPIVAERFKPGA